MKGQPPESVRRAAESGDIEAYAAAVRAAIAEGFCPMCSGPLSPGRTCDGPPHQPLSWSLDGYSLSFEMQPPITRPARISYGGSDGPAGG